MQAPKSERDRSFTLGPPIGGGAASSENRASTVAHNDSGSGLVPVASVMKRKRRSACWAADFVRSSLVGRVRGQLAARSVFPHIPDSSFSSPGSPERMFPSSS